MGSLLVQAIANIVHSARRTRLLYGICIFANLGLLAAAGLAASGPLAGWPTSALLVCLLLAFSAATLGLVRLFAIPKAVSTTLSAALRQFEPFAQRSALGLSLVDLHGRVRYINPALARLVGEDKPQDAVGRRINTYYPEAQQRRLDEEMLPCLVEHGHWEGEFELLCGAHARVPVEEQAFLLRDGEGLPRLIVAIYRDLREQRRTEQQLGDEQALHEQLVGVLPGIYCVLDESGRLRRWNPNLERYTACTTAELCGQLLADLFEPEDGAEITATLKRALSNGHAEVETALTQRDGGRAPFQLSAHRAVLGGRIHLLCFGLDTAERSRADARLRVLGGVFEHSREAILVTDAGNRIIAVNPAFTTLTGYQPEDVLGQDPGLLSSGTTPPALYHGMWHELHRKGHWEGEIWDRRKDGSLYPKWLSIDVVRAASGEISHHIACFHDLSERKEAEDRIRHLAHHDALTGLPNRRAFVARLAEALSAARTQGRPLTVMQIDIDRFKRINDLCGPAVGDQLLVELSLRAADCVQGGGAVARLGGDEFAVLLAGARPAEEIEELADKLLQRLRAPCLVGSEVFELTASIGLSRYPEDGDDAAVLLRHAETAVQHAKAQGRNRLQRFALGLDATSALALLQENRLREALRAGRLLLHYQPLIDLDSGEVRRVEALVRWNDPVEGLIPPERFIPLAEECGLIDAIGAWVVDEALRQLAEWHRQGLDWLKMAVNLSACQLESRELPQAIAEALARHGLRPSHLELEITESAALRDPENAAQVLTRLNGMGVALALDDFGTGYSSLSHLKLLPVASLKMDRSFVRGIDSDPEDAAICAATIALAHELQLNVVAEGVENASQLDKLKRLGCDLVQGFHFSHPLEADRLAALLGSGARPWLNGGAAAS
ncbi:EAL domain-containing protein [Azoarcus indigens]|uniref:PAS domain S-box-containing protein/diguanylate cyclase (GGDEF)-like protein n=1 Tax=Azoarcus indigens TaxID=29545 RepID=A0A4R6DZN4_9RHOO|nr:EAL domain-containing protein [Azoarcus indigens]NMG64755.1 EAL domain-containing protein [Azoarcus indigens]TDN50860.1 PAS domain S-box-containing protein/diguanylate cyclase (GGDEF)-like protein [Azoarcus indigens]